LCEVRVVATAGHVDHGKSTLVQALTGMDPDRLGEEKQRGLTIDLGFAWSTLPSGLQIAFVDVPGHARFIRNMLAGVGMVDGCLLVVAATEGWMPQSEEHLRILELLGGSQGVVAVTKSLAVDDDRRELVREEVAQRVRGTFLDGAGVVDVDSVEGVGLGDLRRLLDGFGAGSLAPDVGRPRLWIDRAFVIKGSGTVVTGTLIGGTLRVGDELAVVPGGHDGRVRALQALHRAVPEVAPGSRVAVNLAGVSLAEVTRGRALVRAAQWRPSSMVDASLGVLAGLHHDVSRRGSYVVYVGSGEHHVRVRLLGRDALRPGEEGVVRLHLPVELPLLPGDRFVLRESGRAETVGGGAILDVAPVLPASRARPSKDVDRVIAEREWVDVDDLEALTGERRPADVGRWVVSRDALAATLQSVRDRVRSAGRLGLDVAILDGRQRAALGRLEDVKVGMGRARMRGAPDDPLADHPYLAALDAAPFNPPEPTDVDRAELGELVRRGHVVTCDGVWFSSSAVDLAARVVAHLLAGNPEGFTVADARDALGTTRKYAVPLLAHLDATGVTQRRGDRHIAGSRLPAGWSPDPPAKASDARSPAALHGPVGVAGEEAQQDESDAPDTAPAALKAKDLG
jgi:selenocysteine-specific elongation factor